MRQKMNTKGRWYPEESTVSRILTKNAENSVEVIPVAQVTDRKTRFFSSKKRSPPSKEIQPKKQNKTKKNKNQNKKNPNKQQQRRIH